MCTKHIRADTLVGWTFHSKKKLLVHKPAIERVQSHNPQNLLTSKETVWLNGEQPLGSSRGSDRAAHRCSARSSVWKEDDSCGIVPPTWKKFNSAENFFAHSQKPPKMQFWNRSLLRDSKKKQSSSAQDSLKHQASLLGKRWLRGKCWLDPLGRF